jgi:hypothetical protein
MFVTIFLAQAALNVGYFASREFRSAFGYALVLIPLAGYLIVLYRLPALQKAPLMIRALAAFSVSGVVWYLGSCVIFMLLLWGGIAKHNF